MSDRHFYTVKCKIDYEVKDMAGLISSRDLGK